MDGLSTLNSFNHTLRILIFLKNQAEEVNQTQVRNGVDVQNPQTISNSLGALEELGFIKTRVEVPRTRWITLTEAGNRVAEHVEAIANELVN